MEPQHEQRRLTTILSADVVGYSRLMAADESGTLAQLKTHRKELIEPKTAEYHGRVVKLMGDGTLMEFGSVVDAVRFAVDVQQAMVERNAKIPEDRRITYRVGINIGDIIVEGDDIYGDGVNIAARLEALADPGGICVARNVFNQVRNKVEAGFEDLGEQTVKNIPEPVQVFRVCVEGSEPAAPAPSTEARTHPSLPDKPSIAVLPFTNMSGDPEQEYFSDGITEDLITELSRFRSLFVIARNSSFTYRGGSVKVQDVGRELGVAYVVEGSVRKAGDRVRVTAQLVEAAAGNHLWAEHYDRELEDIFAVQDEVVRTVVATLVGRLEQAGRESAKRKLPSNLGAYDFFLRGREHFYRWRPRDNHTAREMFEKATALVPDYAAAHAGLAETHFLDWYCGWSAAPEKSLERGVALAQKSVALDDTDSRTHAAMGALCLFRRQYDQARLHFDRALTLNPSDTRAIVHSARFLMCLGKAEQAIQRVAEANRLNPFGKHGWYLGMAYYTARKYEEAVNALQSLRDPVALLRAWLAASYAQAGRAAEARQEATECVAAARSELADSGAPHPNSWVEFVAERCPYQHREDADHLVEGLRKAGLPE